MRIQRTRCPLDAHNHGRDGLILKKVAPMTASQCWGAIFEPNLVPPITTAKQGQAYLEEIRDACKDFPDFKPFLLAYLTDSLDPVALYDAVKAGIFIGAKFYPRGATTNSDNGIADVRTLYTPGTRQFDMVQAVAMAGGVVQLHCELNFELDLSAQLELDPYGKEEYFFAEVMPRLIEAHPKAKFSAEHLSTADGATFIAENGGDRLGCSLTVHHLFWDRRDMFRGGLRPHVFCLPPVQGSWHKEALRDLASQGYSYVWAGTDTAPHDRKRKESECCSGGIFTAHAMLELYTHVFDEIGALNHLDRFVAESGPKFYGLEPSTKYVELVNDPWTVNEQIFYSGEGVIRPFGYAEKEEDRTVINWRLAV